MARERGLAHVTAPMAEVPTRLPDWATPVRAANPGPMTLDGTNTWVLRGDGADHAVVVDPGPADERHLRAVAGYGPFAGVLVTHGHDDHTGGLVRFRNLTGAPRLAADRRQVAGLEITTIATPGHTADSVCLLVEGGGQRAVLTGDTILGRGTTVVCWPDGDFGAYLTSLVRLTGADLVGVPVLPGHGPALADCGRAAAAYLAHRRARLAQVRAAVAAGATGAAEVVARVYPGLDPALVPAAEQSVRAQLAYLAGTGRESPPPASPLEAL